jgi:hypothetical protein
MLPSEPENVLKKKTIKLPRRTMPSSGQTQFTTSGEGELGKREIGKRAGFENRGEEGKQIPVESKERRKGKYRRLKKAGCLKGRWGNRDGRNRDGHDRQPPGIWLGSKTAGFRPGWS